MIYHVHYSYGKELYTETFGSHEYEKAEAFYNILNTVDFARFVVEEDYSSAKTLAQKGSTYVDS